MHEDKRYAWDRHGNLVCKRRGRLREQHYAYDAQGQLTHVLSRSAIGSALAHEQLTAFAYDALGRLTQAGNASAHLRFTYDPL